MVSSNNDRKLHNDKDNLLKEYLYLIADIIRNFENVSETPDTLKNVAYIGLLNAANLYSQGACNMDFKSYAQAFITREIHQYLSDKKYKINQPGWLVKLNQKIDQYVINYQKKHQKFPSLSEISDHINVDNSGLQEILKSRESVNETYFIHHLADDIEKIQTDVGKIRSCSYQHFKLPIEDVIALQKAFLKAKEIQRNIVYYLFIMDLRQTKITQKLGLSQRRANQIKKDLLRYLI